MILQRSKEDHVELVVTLRRCYRLLYLELSWKDISGCINREDSLYSVLFIPGSGNMLRT